MIGSDSSRGRPKVLLLLAKAPDPAIPDRVARKEIPRVEYLELAAALGAEIVDFHSVRTSTHPMVQLAAKRGPLWGLATLGTLRRREFDHIYAADEEVGIPLAVMLRAVRWHGRVTVAFHNGSTSKRTMLLRALGHEVWRNVICFAERQHEILTREVGLPTYKVHRFDRWIDASFYKPKRGGSDGDSRRGSQLPKGPGALDYAFSCGRESRDYPTLQRAAEGLPYKFRVVASGWAPHAGFDPATNLRSASNLEVQSGLSCAELRDAYDAARFVVVPLEQVTYAAGVTGICEGMAMGKAVITSASPGVADYVEDSVSGFVVPVGDRDALRRAIVDLWEHPARAAEMGRRNRRVAEEVLSTDRYVERVAGLFGVRVQRRGNAAVKEAPMASTSGGEPPSRSGGYAPPASSRSSAQRVGESPPRWPGAGR